MKVIVQVSHAGPFTSRIPGKVYDVSKAEASRMIKAGIAIACPKHRWSESLGSGVTMPKPAPEPEAKDPKAKDPEAKDPEANAQE